MRNLEFANGSPQSIKLGDSSNTLSLLVTELDQAVDLSKASSITVKIGNTAGFLTEVDVDVSSLLHPTDGRIDVVIDSKISSELPAGQYLLEVWIDDAHGNTAIYPDTSYPSVIGFSIKKNIMAATSTVITTLTLADFEAKFDDMQKDLQDKVTSGYFKGDKGDQGDKGDTGSVDNDGLINAPAFQVLQKQVNNSAVGTNLYTDTRDFNNPDAWKSYSGWTVTTEKYNGLTVMQSNTNWDGLSQFIAVKKGEMYTYSTYARFTSGTGNAQIYWHLDHPVEGSSGQYATATASPTNTVVALTDGWQRVSSTVTILTDGYIRPRIERTDATTNVLQIAGIKVEKGSVATDWCPNPSEILTQSNYAKIQAAIVALGGSL